MKQTFAIASLAMGLALVAGSAARAQDAAPATPAEQLKAIQADYKKELDAFQSAYKDAKTDEERQKLVDTKYPDRIEFSARVRALIQKSPEDPAVVDAVAWAIQSTPGTDEEMHLMLEVLREHHFGNDRLGSVCSALQYYGSASALEFLEAVRAKSTSTEARGRACYALAKIASEGWRGNVDRERAEALLEEVVEKYGDLKSYRGSLGAQAKGDLFEMRNLNVGQPAPDISGEDIDGVAFKLSDYRGKVVFLDFWGYW